MAARFKVLGKFNAKAAYAVCKRILGSAKLNENYEKPIVSCYVRDKGLLPKILAVYDSWRTEEKDDSSGPYTYASSYDLSEEQISRLVDLFEVEVKSGLSIFWLYLAWAGMTDTHKRNEVHLLWNIDENDKPAPNEGRVLVRLEGGCANCPIEYVDADFLAARIAEKAEIALAKLPD